MPDKQIDLAKLAEPFFPEQIHWRVGATNKEKTKGMALGYIDARDLYDRLDGVCGPANWQCRYPTIREGKTVAEIGIRIDKEWVWKANIAGDTDVESAKGAASDAIKRAGVPWGIGRYLYDLESPWVDLVPFGRSYKIDEKEFPKLRRLLTAKGAIRQNASPEWKCEMTRKELQEKLTALSKDIAACSDHDSLIAMENASTQLINDCKEHLPAWYLGDGGDVKGLKRTLEERHAEFMKRPAFA